LFVSEALLLQVNNHGPRRKRNSDETIALNNKKQFTQDARMITRCIAMQQMGWNDNLTWEERKRIGRAACTLVSYDLGYKKVVGSTQLHTWMKESEMQFSTGNTSSLAKSKHKGTEKYTDIITRDHPHLLHQLFRYSTSILGDNASFDEIANLMNTQSAAMGNGTPVLTLNEYNLGKWFKKSKGILRRTVVRPLLTEEHLQARVEYCHRVLGLIEQDKVIIYLDEKWFYIMSRRKKSKYLPLGPLEPAGSD